MKDLGLLTVANIRDLLPLAAASRATGALFVKAGRAAGP
jgi:hypothetical protein